MRKILHLILFLFVTSTAVAQTKCVTTEYDRVSLTILSDMYTYKRIDVKNEYNDNLKANVIEGITDQKQFDYNYTEDASGAYSYDVLNFTRRQLLKHGKESVDRTLKLRNVGRSIVSYMLNRDKDGNMNTDLIEQRGLYNATLADEQKAEALFIGKDNVLKDQGFDLLKNNYIVVIDRVTRYDQSFYLMGELDLEDLDLRAEEVYVAFIYKLNLEDPVVADQFLRQSYILPTDSPEVREQKNEIFNSIEYEYKFVDFVKTEGWNTKEEVEDVLMRKITNAITEWGVTTPLHSVKPIEARIGTKESVHNNDRFFVYKYKVDDAGEVDTLRVGAVRAAVIGDNIEDNSKRTRFVKIAGRSFEPGYVIKKRDDAGLVFDLGYRTNALDGYNLTWSWLRRSYKYNFYTFPITSTSFQSYNLEEMGISRFDDYFKQIVTCSSDCIESFRGRINGDKIRSYAFGVGYGLGCRFAGNFELEVHGLYNVHWLCGADFYELFAFDEHEEPSRTDGGFQFGAKCKINLYYPLKLFVSADYFDMNYSISNTVSSKISAHSRRMVMLDKCGKSFGGLAYNLGISYTF